MLRKLLDFYKTGPDKPLISKKPEAIRKKYERKRWSVFLTVTIGYGMFYICRLSLAVVKKPLIDAGIFDPAQLGTIGSALLFTYAFGRLTNGFLADRSNIKKFMSTGLMISAIINLVLGSVTLFYAFLILWGLNGWFQSMGSAPSVVSLTHWFSHSERGTRYGIWSTSHCIGEGITFAGIALVVTAWGWRSGFVLPGIICVVTALVMLITHADRPETYGLPSISDYKKKHAAGSGEIIPHRGEGKEADRKEKAAFDGGGADGASAARRLDRDDEEGNKGDEGDEGDEGEKREKHGGQAGQKEASEIAVGQLQVLKNPWVWVLGLAGATMYVPRYGINNWAIAFLQMEKGHSLAKAGLIASAAPIAGLVGSIASGLVSDKLFAARRNWPTLIYGLLQIGSLIALYSIPPGHLWVDGAAMCLFGFATGGLLVFLGGLNAVDIVSRRAAGAAMGMIGLFSYLGAGIQEVVSGYLVDSTRLYTTGGKAVYIFDRAFVFWGICSIASILLAASTWKVRPKE